MRAIVEAGGDVESLSVLSSTLEDIYLKLAEGISMSTWYARGRSCYHQKAVVQLA